MAATSYGVNSNEAVKLWSKKLSREVLKETWASKFMGTDSNSLIQVVDQLQKEAGDRVRCILRMQLSGAGVQGDATLETNEETLMTYTDDLYIDQLRHAVLSAGKMTEQRIPFDIREEARLGLQDWFSDRIDTWFMNQISGNSGETDTKKTGNQAATAPDSSHRLYAGGMSSEATLTATASGIFHLGLVDKAVLKAKTLTPSIRPLRKGPADYVMFITPEQHYDLRSNAGTMEWADIQKAAIQGGKIADNPIFTGAIGIYNGVLLHESFRLPRITTAAGALKGGRSVLAGAQAVMMAYGRDSSSERFRWVEKLFDYENSLGVSAGIIAGLKKTIYNSQDFATITVSSAHSANAVSASGR
jgi:N4-gp56 family major capsid protein